MRRLTHHQYTTISMIEDVLEGHDLTRKISLYVDTWRPGSETWSRVALVQEQALLGSIDAEWYEKTILGLMLEVDGSIVGDEGAVLRLDDGRITMTELSEYLAGYADQED